MRLSVVPLDRPVHPMLERTSARRASDEGGVAIVRTAGGEPLLHPQIADIVGELVDRRRFVYLCTNALLLERKLDAFQPSKYLSFSVHMDGPRGEHDLSVCREGVYDVAVNAIRAALKRGFRVTTNTTLFEGADPERMRGFFDDMMELGVEGMMVSPGYSYEKAPDQEHFLRRARGPPPVFPGRARGAEERRGIATTPVPPDPR